MKNVKEHISNFLIEKFKADEYDINKGILDTFMDSLDIVELVFEIERHYEIDVYDDWYAWGEATVDDIVKYIEEKINKNGE